MNFIALKLCRIMPLSSSSLSFLPRSTQVFTTRAEVYAAQDDIQELVLPLIGTDAHTAS